MQNKSRNSSSRTRSAVRWAPHVVSLLLALSAASSSAIACPCAEIRKPPAEDTNVSIPAGIEFSHSAEYLKQFTDAINSARTACEKHKGEQHLAIVSDLDETLLDNREDYEKHPEFKWSQFKSWIKSSDAPLLSQTADFLSWARDNGYAIFFVTGRNESVRADTIQNLIRRKVAYDGLYMRPVGDKRRAEDVKTELRKSIEDAGFKIIVSIGDQDSDLYGGHAEDCEKLPNKMYFIP